MQNIKELHLMAYCAEPEIVYMENHLIILGDKENHI